MQQLLCPQPAAAGALLFVLTAKVESWGSSLPVWQLGHSAFCSPKRMASNLCPHCFTAVFENRHRDSNQFPETLESRKCELAHPHAGMIQPL